MKTCKNVALILRGSLSSWKSCQLISSNLYETYKIVFRNDNVKIFYVEPLYNRYLANKTAKDLKLWGADIIVWMEHSPCASLLVEELSAIYNEYSFELRPSFIIHVFGDFVLDCNSWISAKEAMINWPLHFVAASYKQQQIIEDFFESKVKIVSSVPFPVNEKIFNNQNSEENRLSIREKLGADEKDKIILYTGRISYQKNVDTLIKIFKSIEPLFEDKIQLWIAGPWDDILIPYFGKNGRCGSFYRYFFESVGSLKNSRVKFLGNQASSDLVKIYHAADLFVSFSTYNDEDYGMAPAEAMCTGLPCLLSNWAGYSNFKDYSDQVKLVPIDVSLSRPNVQADAARISLIKSVMNIDYNKEKSLSNSLEAHEFLGIENVAKNINKLLVDMKFGAVEGFTPVFLKLCTRFKNNPRAPFEIELYQEVYGHYGI